MGGIIFFMELMLNSYKNIRESFNPEFKKLEEFFEILLEDRRNYLTKDIKNYLFSSSKRIRALLIFLFASIFDDKKAKSEVIKLAAIVELIHNATLIHDDIIDDSDTRRGEISFNYKFGNRLAVIAGDYVLSMAFKQLYKLNNTNVIAAFTEAIEGMCLGEINQYFEKGTVPSIEKYIEKSRAKTANLFEAGLVSLFCLLGKEEYIPQIKGFAENFGIAFQIRDDLINISKSDSSKPALNDYKEGIYTAPFIFFNEQNGFSQYEDDEEFLKKLFNSSAISDTNKLLNKYINSAIDSISFVDDNQAKDNIIALCEYLREVEEN